MIEVRRSLDGVLLGHLDIPLTLAFETQALLFPTMPYFTEGLDGCQSFALMRLRTGSVSDVDAVTGKTYHTNVVWLNDAEMNLQVLQASGLFRARA